MPRQRMFHPSFWASKRLNKLRRIKGDKGSDAVLFYWGMVSLSDDEGRGICDFDYFFMLLPILQLKEELVSDWLETIIELDLIRTYEHKNNETIRYYFVPDWFNKQKIPKPYPSETPLPTKDNFDKSLDYFRSLVKLYGRIIQRFNSEDKIIPNQLRTNNKLARNWLGMDGDIKEQEEGKEFSFLTKTFLAIISEYRDFNVVHDKDGKWFEKNISANLEYSNLNIAEVLEGWGSWLEQRNREKEKGIKKHKFPKDFKKSLRTRLRKAIEFGQAKKKNFDESSKSQYFDWLNDELTLKSITKEKYDTLWGKLSEVKNYEELKLFIKESKCQK